VLSKKRKDMKDKIFEVAKNHTENEETAMQLTNELCFLLGVVCSETELAEHKCKFYVNADWSYLKCGCGKRIKPKG